MNLGDRIKEIRRDCSLTQSEFAERMLVSASYISKIESGSEKPSDIFLKLMSLEFNISLNWLKTGTGTKEIRLNEYDYFERNQNYGTNIRKDLLDFQKTIEILPKGIDSSTFFMLEEYTHILKSEYLTESQKVLISSIIADIFTDMTEMIDKFFTINKNDEKDLLRFERFSIKMCETILDHVKEIKNTLIPKKVH